MSDQITTAAGCRCCSQVSTLCKCYGVGCKDCSQCEAHCECLEMAEQAEARRKSIERTEQRILNLKEQEKNLNSGLMKSGMLPSEAAQRARVWWDRVGHNLIHTQFNQEQVGGSFKASNGKAPGLKIAPSLEHCIQSGILQGVKWRFLTPREKKQVVICWHEVEVMQKMPLYKEKFGLEFLSDKPKSQIIH